MQAIETKWISPTNTKGSRIRAKCQGGSVMVSWDHSLGITGNHVYAALKLIEKMGWVAPHYGVDWVHGENTNGNGFVFVNVDAGGHM